MLPLVSAVRSARIALNPIQSAKISTAGRFNVKYGRVEVEAKIPVGDWIWPAIWLLPEVRSWWCLSRCTNFTRILRNNAHLTLSNLYLNLGLVEARRITSCTWCDKRVL